MDRNESPPVTAVFLVVFDQKIGYTIAWKRSLPSIDLDGVEYKSLPSGLHAVKEDLVYFVHNGDAAISIFVQEEADAKHRNANFAAVGALVPRSYGQLGRSWIHAEELRRLAREVVKKPSDTRPLELFWNRHRADSTARNGSTSPVSKRPEGVHGRTKKRALSDATLAGLDASHALPADHPALYMPALLDVFGPLLFPLHRAVLSRRRVLLMGNPSVQANANTVYLVSVLAGIPPSLSTSLPLDAEPMFRGSALFSVGIHDIPNLAGREDGHCGWLACTTDDILGEKKNLYDVLVQLPSTQPQTHKAWPRMKTSDGRIIKATQRDQRRWVLLKRELRRLRRQFSGSFAERLINAADGEDDERPILRRSPTSAEVDEYGGLDGHDESDVVEPSSWSALAYRGFMWWASAGEASAWENDEAKADEELLFDMPDVDSLMAVPVEGSDILANGHSEYSHAAATLVVAYFRRVTESIVRPLASIVEDADDEAEDGIQEDDITVTAEDVRAMGLDTWNDVDKIFIRDMLKTWFDRTATVTDQGMRVCGVKIC